MFGADLLSAKSVSALAGLGFHFAKVAGTEAGQGRSPSAGVIAPKPPCGSALEKARHDPVRMSDRSGNSL